MFRIHDFFLARRGLTLAALWSCFALALAYGLTALLLRPDWNFWLMALPAGGALYFRVVHAQIQGRDR